MKYLLTVISTVVLAATVCANDFDDLVKRAEAGDSVAQFEVGYAYAEGIIVEKDCILAEQWIRKAAEKNYQPAQLGLAAMFDDFTCSGPLHILCGPGSVRGRTHDGCTKWYRKAAEQGGEEAVSAYVWHCISDGDCGQEETLEWMIKGAELGYDEVQAHLGNYYAFMAADTVSAYVWLVLSKLSGRPNDGLNPDPFAKYMTTTDLAQAQFQLGERYYEGRAVEQDYCIAESWYRKSAENGHFKAQTKMCHIYDPFDVSMTALECIDELPFDRSNLIAWSVEWERWHREAVRHGTLEALINFAWHCRSNGTCTQVELIDALTRAAEMGHVESQFNLAGRLNQGPVAAYMWWVIAAKGGNKFARSIVDADILNEWISPDQIAEAKRLAREWIEAHPTIDSANAIPDTTR